MFSSLADAILVSGPLTGHPVEASDLKRVREAVPDVPVFANTGVRIDNVREIFAHCDGCVIGTHFKIGGDTWKAVDPDRVKRFMDFVHAVTLTQEAALARDCVIGLDIGTTSTLGALIAPPDAILAVAQRPTTLSSPHPGWAEEDPAQWWA